jgi:hypothetical protein
MKMNAFKTTTDWNGNVVSIPEKNTQQDTTPLHFMHNRMKEINSEPVGERLSKTQYANLMQIKTYAKQLKMQMKLADLEQQLLKLQSEDLSPAEMAEKLSLVESKIDEVVSMARSATKANPQQFDSADMQDKASSAFKGKGFVNRPASAKA